MQGCNGGIECTGKCCVFCLLRYRAVKVEKSKAGVQRGAEAKHLRTKGEVLYKIPII